MAKDRLKSVKENIIAGANLVGSTLTLKRNDGSRLNVVVGGGSGGDLAVRLIDGDTPKDGDGNTVLTVDDGLVFIDATDDDSLYPALPDDAEQGKMITLVKVDDGTNTTFITTVGSFTGEYNGNNRMYSQGDVRTVVFDGTNWNIGGSSVGDLNDLNDYTGNSIEPNGLVSVLTQNLSGQWGISTAGQNQVLVLDNDSNGYTLLPDQFALVDATNGNVTLTLANFMFSVVRVKKTDASANTVTVASAGGAGFSNIDGAPTKVLTTQDEIVTFVRDQNNVWHTF